MIFTRHILALCALLIATPALASPHNHCHKKHSGMTCKTERYGRHKSVTCTTSDEPESEWVSTDVEKSVLFQVEDTLNGAMHVFDRRESTKGDKNENGPAFAYASCSGKDDCYKKMTSKKTGGEAQVVTSTSGKGSSAMAAAGSGEAANAAAADIANAFAGMGLFGFPRV
ncbi:hypothetical protein K488DRAFT_73997 [Vararia minispora EC-137]|uniref:Uncharacterized protein n=1 Tax=Vararia minispora EC-137 TaxID=1314806 RepID=A0ACB8Q8V0_9AGAM|nr:hypothetical protein K488DRAFT_73997 [Vararia minispora EC-137]